MRLGCLLCAVLIGVGSFLRGADGWRDGEVVETVVIRVVGENGAKPIVGAKVWLLTGEDAAEYEWSRRNPETYAREHGSIERLGSHGATDAEGSVSMTARFKAAWHDNRDGTTRMNRVFAGVIVVEAQGFRRLESSLESLIPSPPPVSLAVTVELKPE